jgi:Putative auto-transporter adhesin, head GIN domain
MKKAILACFIVCTAYFAIGQDKVINDANAQKRTVGSFHAIRAEDGIDLYITQGSEEAVAVSAASVKYRDKIRTEVRDGVLRIYVEEGFNFSLHERKMKAYVSVKVLDAIHGSGGSDVYMKEGVKADNFRLSLSGGSDFYGKITATKLSADLSGGSDVHINGSVVTLNVSASGGSDFKGYELTADNVTINASGGSDAQLTVNKELVAEVSGGSDIDYKGSGVVRNVSSSGSSSINKRG